MHHERIATRNVKFLGAEQLFFCRMQKKYYFCTAFYGIIGNKEYVRLRDIGKYESEIKKIQAEEQQIYVFPSPTGNLLNVKYFTKDETGVVIMVFDVYGRVIVSRDIKVHSESEAVEQFDVSRYQSGCYFVVVKIGTEVQKPICIIKQ